VIELTDDFLKSKIGTARYYPAELDHPIAGTWTIEIPLEPFSADDEYDPATFRPGSGGPEFVETEIVLDFIKLPADDLSMLTRRTFTFPVGHEEGFIDGSIYLIATHCPVDVTRIDFGESMGNQITATFHAHFDFDRARGIEIRNRTAALETTLRFELGHIRRPA
jgi:hypothetical protein